MTSQHFQQAWYRKIRVWFTPRSITIFFLGFSAGLPLLLLFSPLSIWLREAGISRSAVTFFSWAALPYSFKFLWAPLVDLLPLPLLSRLLGRRRAWLCLAQIGVITFIIVIAFIDPAGQGNNLLFMSLATVALGFSSATQDIVIDAYRIECAEKEYQALLAAMYMAGYRVGMLVSGAGSLFLAQFLGTSTGAISYSAWRLTYFAMALCMGVGFVTTLVIREPIERGEEEKRELYRYPPQEYLQLLALFLLCAAVFAVSFFYGGVWLTGVKNGMNSNLASFFLESIRFLCSLACAALVGWMGTTLKLVNRQMVYRSYIEPVADFFVRYGAKSALIILLLIGCYRFSDIVLGVIANVFYLDMGFSKANIAAVSKSYGLCMTLFGGFVGGGLALRYGVYRILVLGALLSSLTNILFLMLSKADANIPMLIVVLSADNLAAGIAGAAFVAFLSSLTSYSFTAVQYAIFSSIMTLFPKFIGGYSGTIVAAAGYDIFFLLTAVAGIPVLMLIWLVCRQVGEKTAQNEGVVK